MSSRNATSPWKKRILIPFWIVRILLDGSIVIFYLIALGLIASGKTGDSELGVGITPVGIVFVILILGVFILDVVAIVLFSCGRLKPKVLFSFNVFQTLVWLALVILEAVDVANGGKSSGLILSIIILLSFTGILLYSLSVYLRTRKYQVALNPANEELFPPHHRGSYNPSPYEPYKSTTVHGTEMQRSDSSDRVIAPTATEVDAAQTSGHYHMPTPASPGYTSAISPLSGQPSPIPATQNPFADTAYPR